MNKENCLFCKIVNHEIPSYKVYEDEDVYAFLDISQATPGHTLVIPKEHYDNFLATPKEIMHKVMDVAQRIGQAQVVVMNAKGVNIISNVGKDAGQSVFHYHVHVIPRYDANDGIALLTKENPNLSSLNLPAIADSINKGIK